jgi:hypothetical protein
MPEAFFAPVFTAEARALIGFLEKEIGRSQNGRDVSQLKAVLKTVLPDILETPARMKRLNNELVEWLMSRPRTAQEVEEAREELSEILQTQADILGRILDIATRVGFPSSTLTLVKTAIEQTYEVRGIVFQHWQPFTKADYEAALEEIEHGQSSDLDEVIRELQGRVK